MPHWHCRNSSGWNAYGLYSPRVIFAFEVCGILPLFSHWGWCRWHCNEVFADLAFLLVFSLILIFRALSCLKMWTKSLLFFHQMYWWITTLGQGSISSSPIQQGGDVHIVPPGRKRFLPWRTYWDWGGPFLITGTSFPVRPKFLLSVPLTCRL